MRYPARLFVSVPTRLAHCSKHSSRFGAQAQSSPTARSFSHTILDIPQPFFTADPPRGRATMICGSCSNNVLSSSRSREALPHAAPNI